MSAATAKLAGGARRALGGRQGAAVELGAPPTWPACELQRVRTQARELVRARGRRHARGVIALDAALATVATILGVNVLETVGAAVLAVVAWWAHQTSGETPVVARWRTWAHGRRVLERELRLLGPAWRILWDRRVQGLPTPAILAVGPSGAWTLWWPEPGINIYRADAEAAARTVSEAGGLPAVAYMLQRPSQQLRMLLHDMACAAAVASRDDVARAAEQLHTMLLQEPVGVGL
jgi:hypothetical protein